MKSRISIRRVWNSPDDRAAIDALVGDGYYVRRRGRGYRHGRRSYWQSLPQDKATYLTYYLEPRENFGEREVPRDPFQGTRCDCCGMVGGFWDTGKVCRDCGRGIFEAVSGSRTERYMLFDAPHVGLYYQYEGVDARSGKPRLRPIEPGSRTRWQ